MMRANAKWKETLRAYEPPPLDVAVDEALKEFMARKRFDAGHLALMERMGVKRRSILIPRSACKTGPLIGRLEAAALRAAFRTRPASRRSQAWG